MVVKKSTKKAVQKKVDKSHEHRYARYDHAVIAVDGVVFSLIDGKLHVLLIKMQKLEMKGLWAVPGGLVGSTETLEDALSRVMNEKTGLTNIFLEQLRTFGAVERGPIWARRVSGISGAHRC